MILNEAWLYSIYSNHNSVEWIHTMLIWNVIMMHWFFSKDVISGLYDMGRKKTLSSLYAAEIKIGNNL